ncbi:MAG TPA: AAA family ATPase [Thermodesulfobacteriota bacterium]|nr:AAA family ATPase [Thermodesulfobacteriota bacterium]
MYLDFHGFREKPFNLTPDPRFVFLSKNHKEAFAHLLYGIKNRVGFIALTGEVGSGKTTILRTLLSQLDADHYRTALIFNPCLSPTELLQNISREFGITNHTSNDSALLDPLNRFLLQQNAEGRTVVLAIDEAQDLETQVLEQIRLISNLETDREKLIQIILAGQPEFIQILNKKEMRQLSQRITVRYHLQPMDFQDTVDYINHRLKVAGGKERDIFSKRSLKRIYAYSTGLPRLVNAACDRALLTGYTRDATRIDSRIVAAGVKDIRKNMSPYSPKRRFVLIPTTVMLAVLFAGIIYLKWDDMTNLFNPHQQIRAPGGDQSIADPVITGEELFRAMVAELGKVTETESARRAFNQLAGLWKVPSISENSKWNPSDRMGHAAEERELRVYRFSGNLGALLRLDYPAALALTLPGIQGKRFISLVGMKNEKLLIDPPIAGRSSLSYKELEKHWSGQGFLLWKDFSNLLTRVSSESKGNQIRRFQDLLREVGAYSRSSTGVYDDQTLLAIKEFQSSKGIEQDGIVGGQTLMVLYRSIDRFGVPRLTVERK